MGVDLYWEDKRRRERGYSAGYEDGQKSIAKQIKGVVLFGDDFYD